MKTFGVIGLTHIHFQALALNGNCLRKHLRHLCTSMYHTQIGSNAITVIFHLQLRSQAVTPTIPW
jgi:hypothetical protein